MTCATWELPCIAGPAHAAKFWSLINFQISRHIQLPGLGSLPVHIQVKMATLGNVRVEESLRVKLGKTLC